VDVEASARKHGGHEDDMLHALRHHLRAFETDDASVTMFMGPARDGALLEVVSSSTTTRPSCTRCPLVAKFLEGWWTS